MNILFIGGTGVISSASLEMLAQQNENVTVLNRGKTDRKIPDGVEVLHGDMRNPDAIEKLLKGRSFDVVVDWIVFEPEHIETDIRLFTGKTGHYIFISSASAYQTPTASLPVTESTPLKNPFWEYSRKKIACEQLLIEAYRKHDFPMTIVRPSHTYDRTLLPFRGDYTMLGRMKEGRKVVVHGDGTSLWTLTHHRDFAKGFVPLLGNYKAIGNAYHITSDEVLTWNQIYQMMANTVGGTFNPVYIPSNIIANYDADWGAGLLGDKAHSMIFDNSKIKKIVPEFTATIPFEQGAKEITDWYAEHPEHCEANAIFDGILDDLIESVESL